jgi:hypothetical protein
MSVDAVVTMATQPPRLCKELIPSSRQGNARRSGHYNLSVSRPRPLAHHSSIRPLALAVGALLAGDVVRLGAVVLSVVAEQVGDARVFDEEIAMKVAGVSLGDPVMACISMDIRR